MDETSAGEWALPAVVKPASKDAPGLWGHLGICNISYTMISVGIVMSVCVVSF